MKKVLLGMLVVVVAVGLAINAYSAEYKETTKVKTKGDTTTETTKVKAGDVKVTTTPTSTKTEEKMKGKNVKMEKTTTDTAKGSTGKAKVDIKKGELKKLSIDWVYYRQGPEYIIEYDVKKMKTGRVDEDIKTDLNLTDNQFKLITPGKHTITSTSPYTADDVKSDFRTVIIQDLASSVKK